MADKQRSQETRDRKAEALRANLRKRKAATRKLKEDKASKDVSGKNLKSDAQN